MYRFCEDHRVPHARCGKLIIASDEHEIADLDRLLAVGHANGVSSLDSRRRRLYHGPRSPTSGRSPRSGRPTPAFSKRKRFVKTLEHCAGRTTWRWSSAARSSTPHLMPSRHRARSRRTSGSSPARWSTHPAFTPTACRRCLAAWHSRSIPAAGEYAELAPSRRAMVNGLVYPLPHASGAGLGVHLAKTTWGTGHAGTDDSLPGSRKTTTKAGACRSKSSSSRRNGCCRGSRSRICNRAAAASAPSCTGRISGFADFLIERDTVNPRVIQASGIDSPGLTSSSGDW